jgi:hypothetical protein
MRCDPKWKMKEDEDARAREREGGREEGEKENDGR